MIPELTTEFIADESARDAADTLQSLRRDLTGHYLRAREEWEADRSDPAAAAYYEAMTTALVRVLIATGDYLRDADARAAVAALTVPMMAERFVSEWAGAEDLLWLLDSGGIVAVADDVRDAVAEGVDLDQIPMRSLVEPYLTGGAL